MDKDFVRKFLKGSASTSIGTFGVVVLHFLSITVMTRSVPKEGLGLYFLILAIANGGKIFASLGLDLTLVKFLVSEDKDTQEHTFAAVIWTRIGILLSITAFSFIFGGYVLSLFDTDIAVYRWHVPLLIALMSFRELFFYVLQGLERYQLYIIIQTTSAVLKLVLVFALMNSLSLSLLIVIEFVMLISSLLIQLWTIPFSQLTPPRLLFDRSILPTVFAFGFPLYVNSIFTYISNFGAVFIVGLFLSPASIAAYEVAKKIPEGMMRLFTSFRVVYFPSLSSLFTKDDLYSAQKLMNKSLVLLASGTFVAVLGALLFSHEIVLLIFSDRYLDVQPAFVLLVLSVCLHLLATTMGYSLVSAGRPKHSTQVNIVAMSLELLLSLLLIPRFGYIGAAYAYIAMTFVSQSIAYLYLKRAGVMVNLRSFTKPFVFLALVSGVYLLVDSEGFLWRAALLGLYVALCGTFIPDCRQAITYLWNMAQEMRLQQRAEPGSN